MPVWVWPVEAPSPVNFAMPKSTTLTKFVRPLWTIK